VKIYSISQSFTIAFALMPTIINMIVIILVGWLSVQMRYKTKTEIIKQDMEKIF